MNRPAWMSLSIAAIYLLFASIGSYFNELFSVYELTALAMGAGIGMMLSLKRCYAIGLIFFGILFSCSAYFSADGTSSQSFSILIYLALISIAQVLVGVLIFRRFVCIDNDLKKDYELIYLLLAAPVIGITSTVLLLLSGLDIGVTQQRSMTNELYQLWAFYSLSVILITPFTMSLLNSTALWKKRRALLFVNLSFVFFIAVTLVIQVRKYEEQQLVHEFEILTNQAATSLHVSLKEKELFQASVSQLFSSSEQVTRQEFQEFVQGLTKRERFVQVIEWLPKVLHQQRNAYENEQRQYFGKSFSITQVVSKGQVGRARDKEAYFPITYLEPEWDNYLAEGFDPSSSKAGRAIIEKAIITGNAQTRAPLSIIRNTDFKKVMITYQPIFKHFDGGLTTQPDNAEIYGFISMVIHIDDLIKKALSVNNQQYFSIDWLDTKTGKYYYQSIDNAVSSTFIHRVPIQTTSREMQLVFAPKQAFFTEMTVVNTFFAVLTALVLGAFSSLLLLNITARRARIEAEVEQRTQELNLATQQARQSELKIREAYDAMHIAEAQLKLSDVAFNSASEAILITDKNLKIIAVNAAFNNITGYDESDILGHSANSFIVSFEGESGCAVNELWKKVNKQSVWRGEVSIMKRDAEQFPAYMCLSAVSNEHEKLTNFVGVFSDITDSKKAQQAIEHHANYDSLTGLPNRRLFNDRLEHSISRSKRHNSRLCLMFLDLDRFKDINDTLGHEFGDELLSQVGMRLQKVLRDADTVARLGGDEFTVIIDDVDNKDDIELLAEKLVSEIRQPLKLFNQTLSVTTSIGITFYPEDSTSSKALIQNADRAMYDAKDFGGNTYKLYNSELEASWNARHFIINELETAIEQHQLLIYFQPIIKANHPETISYAEALVRWQHPERGLIPPSEFLPVAERMGVIDKIDDFVFEQVCKQISHWKTLGISDICIAVNQSALNFGKLEGRLQWDECIARYGIRFEQITMEITESMLMQRSSESRKYIQSLRDKGIKIAVDDFGTGYSSLAYLKALDIDYLKIDRSFIRDIDVDEDDRAIISAIVEMAKQLNIETIAEGVETSSQEDILHQMNCHWLQGYYYSEPVPVEKLTATIQSQLSRE